MCLCFQFIIGLFVRKLIAYSAMRRDIVFLRPKSVNCHQMLIKYKSFCFINFELNVFLMKNILRNEEGWYYIVLSKYGLFPNKVLFEISVFSMECALRTNNLKQFWHFFKISIIYKPLKFIRRLRYTNTVYSTEHAMCPTLFSCISNVCACVIMHNHKNIKFQRKPLFQLTCARILKIHANWSP